MSKLLFIGAGKMASAIAGGIVKADLFAAQELSAVDISSQAALLRNSAPPKTC